MSAISLLPQPLSLVEKTGSAALHKNVKLTSDKELTAYIPLLAHVLQTLPGCRPEPVDSSREATLRLRYAPALWDLGEEGYRLETDPSGITITTRTRAGVFYAAQTLLQLVPESAFTGSGVGSEAIALPAVTICDRPRFAWRGIMLDVARHFFSVAYLRTFIDRLAAFKFNVLHLHLTDDQGWRVEIKAFPRLTQIGSQRPQTLVGHFNSEPHVFDGMPYGGFYTQEELRDLVAYALERGVTIVPEIDLPGHMQAAICAYPAWGNLDTPVEVSTVWGISIHTLNAKDETVAAMKTILSEVMEIFPGPYIHIGGDEAKKEEWQTSAHAQEKIRALGLHDEHGLQSWYIRQMEAHIAAAGRRLIGWSEILEGGLAPGAAVTSWLGEKAAIAAARAGQDAVLCDQRSLYFDYYQNTPAREPLAIGGLTTTRNVYDYEPLPACLNTAERAHILGAQGQLWTEYIPDAAQLEYMLFPRGLALAERLWSPADQRDWADFTRRLSPHLRALERQGANFYRGPLEAE